MKKNFDLTPLSIHCAQGDTSPLFQDEIIENFSMKNSVQEINIKNGSTLGRLTENSSSNSLGPKQYSRRVRKNYNCQSFTEAMYQWNGYFKQKFGNHENLSSSV